MLMTALNLLQSNKNQNQAKPENMPHIKTLTKEIK